MTIRESLLAVSAYPIPMRTIEAISHKRGIVLDDDADFGTAGSPVYRLAVADLYLWLYFAPNVAQGGQNYSFTAEQRELWKKQALAIYDEFGEANELSETKGQYGYMGHRL